MLLSEMFRAKTALSMPYALWFFVRLLVNGEIFFCSRPTPVENQAEEDGDKRRPDQLHLERDFVGFFARRHKRKNDADDNDEQSHATDDPDTRLSTRNQDRMRIVLPVASPCKLNSRREHIQKRNEIQNNRGENHKLVRALNCFRADLAEQQNRSRKRGLHEDG